MTGGSPVPDVVATELERVARRLHQLALDHALSHAPALRALAEELAEELAGSLRGPDEGRPPGPVELRDLGPATALDQLRVCIHDAAAARALPADLGDRLVELRRRLT